MLNRNAVVAAIILVFALASGVSAKNAVQSASINQRNPLPVIEVDANRSGYTKVSSPKIDYTVRVAGACESGGSLLRLTASGDRFEGGPAPETVSKQFSHPLPQNAGAILKMELDLDAQEKTLAIQACFNNLTLKMASGMTEAEVLSKTFLVDGPTLVRGRNRAVCARPSNLDADGKYSGWRNLISKVRCNKAPFVGVGGLTDKPRPQLPPGPDGLKNEFSVTKLPLWMTPKNQSGRCPLHLSMNGEIHTNGPGTVRYRLRHNDVTSGIRTLEFTKAGAKNIHYSHTVHGPSTNSNNSGGIGGLSSNTSEDQANGFFQVLIESPNRGMKSSPAFYQVTCETDDSPPLGTKRPDLEPMSAHLNNSRGPEPYEFRAKVRNIGAAPSSATAIKMLYWIGPDPAFAMISIPALGQGKTHSVSLPLSTKPTKLGVHVDPDDIVNESNEANNTLTLNP